MSDSESLKKYSKLKSLQRVYEISIETRNFEISQLTNRNNYYMLFQGVLLAAALSNQASKPIVEFIISLTGIGVSYNQMKVAAGAKFWQEYWEYQASEAEKSLKAYTEKHYEGYKFTDLFNLESSIMKDKVIDKFQKESNNKGLFNKCLSSLILTKSSVSRAPIYTAIVLLLCWIVLMLHTLNFEFGTTSFGLQIMGHYFVK